MSWLGSTVPAYSMTQADARFAAIGSGGGGGGGTGGVSVAASAPLVAITNGGLVALSAPGVATTDYVATAIAAIPGSTAGQALWDSQAFGYITNRGITDLDSAGRINGFVLAMKGFGIWTGSDALLCRTNFNLGTLVTFSGHYATNYGSVLIDGAGAHFDGTDYSVVPMTIGPTNTVLFVYAGDEAANYSQTPFGLFNLAGTNFGAIYPFSGPVGGNKEQRWAISCNGSGEISSLSSGWFQSHGTTNGNGSAYLYPQDFRLHMWSLSWDNAGNEQSYLDGPQNLATSGYATRLTNAALNSVVLGARLNASGTGEGFAVTHVQAVLVWDRVLSSNEVWCARSAVAHWLLPGEKRIVIIGDSMSTFNGPISSDGTAATNYWPAILYGAEGCGPGLGRPFASDYAMIEIAVSGGLADDFDATRIQSWAGPYGLGGMVKSVEAVVWVGINNLGGSAQSGSVVFGNVSNVVVTARSLLGAKVTGVTLPNVGNQATNSFPLLPAYYTNSIGRSIFNSLVMTDPLLFDRVVDLDTAFPVWSMQTNNGVIYSLDGLHLTPAGNSNAAAQFRGIFPQKQYAGKFSGDGSGLTNVPGSGASLTNLPAAQLTGTLPTNTIPALLPSSITGNASSATTAGTVSQTTFTNLTVAGNGSNTNRWTYSGSGVVRTNDAYPGLYENSFLSPTGIVFQVVGNGTNILTINTNGAVTVGALRTASGTNVISDGGSSINGVGATNANITVPGTATLGPSGGSGTPLVINGDFIFGRGGAYERIYYGVGQINIGDGPTVVIAGDLSGTSTKMIQGFKAIKWLSVTSSNPPTSGAGTAFLFAATNGVTGTAEIYAMDGSGNTTIISPHSQDAPSALYDDDDEMPKITREIQSYTGNVRWINESRMARQTEMTTKLALNSLAYYQFTTGKSANQWTNSNSYGFYTNAIGYLDPLTAAQRQLVIVESFADFNSRLSLTNGNGLVKVKWSDVQTKLQADYATSFTNDLTQWTNSYAAWTTNVLTQTNAVAPVMPTWTPPAVQPVPQWLQKRGVN